MCCKSKYNKYFTKSHEKIYAHIGFMVNLSQMIEYNLANILALNDILSAFDKKEEIYVFEYNELLQKANEYYENLEKKELGKLLGEINKKEIFTKELILEIDKIREERNYFIHRFFKDDLFTKKFQNKPGQFTSIIKNLIGKMYIINEELVKIFSDMKKEVKMIN